METLDRHLEIEWHRAIIMMEPRPGVQALFIYAGTPGAFRAVIKIEQRDKGNFNSSNLSKEDIDLTYMICSYG